MNRHLRLCATLFCLCAGAVLTAGGCNDVGNSGQPGQNDAGDDGTLAEAGGEAGQAEDSAADAQPDGGGGEGAADAVSEQVEAEGQDAAEDRGPDAETDTGVDAPADTGVDASVDTGVDAPVDSGVDSTVDSGGAEAGPDTGPEAATDSAADAPHDAAPDGTGTVDASDGGQDSGACTPPAGLQGACNSYVAANTTTNKNASGSTCTATEDVVFQIDGTGVCLGCMFHKGCLDDTQGDTGQECGDPIDHGTEAQCLATLACGAGVPTTNCGVQVQPPPAAGNAFNPYCGIGATVNQCEAVSPGPIGACATQETAGFPTLSTGADIISNYASLSPTYASSIANAIFSCAISNCSTQCNF